MTSPRLAGLTTLGVGGPAREYVEAPTEAELIDAVRDADEAGIPLLVLGGGSNLVVADAGFDGRVVRDMRTGVRAEDDSACAGASVTVAAGAPWDDVVARACAEGWVGIEALSGIPGSTGATPVQNVGAYGQQVSDVVSVVRVWDRAQSRVRTLARGDCGFGYRDSLLKRSMRGEADDGRAWAPSPRFVVLDVTLQMRFATLALPIARPDVAAAVGVAAGERAPLAEVREAVLGLRRSKGMVVDPADLDSRSVGSFFVNPVLGPEAAAALPPGAPRYEPEEGGAAGAVKTSAAWLIEQAGFARGFALPGSHAALSGKHTLALTNRGGASAAEVLALARTVRDGVRDAFGVDLVPEPVLVGATL